MCDTLYGVALAEIEELITAQIQEIRRGTVVLACLLLLTQPQNGYSLLAALEEQGFPVEGNTLYPLLRRLEKQGLLTSEWDTTEARPRKYYTVSDSRRSVDTALAQEWNILQRGFNQLQKTAAEDGEGTP